MSLDVLIQGRLRGAVTVKALSNGNPYAMFKLSTTDKKGDSILASCITFSASTMETMQRLSDGDTIAVSGEAAISQWHSAAGEARVGLDVTVHAALTACHTGRKRGDKPQATQNNQNEWGEQ